LNASGKNRRFLPFSAITTSKALEPIWGVRQSGAGPLFLFYPGHRQVPAALRALIEVIRAGHSRAPTGKSVASPFVTD
jgi:hypothetical protein